jgi:PKD repeat protein
MGKRFASILSVCAFALSAGCTVHQTDAPPLTGPSELALSILLTAIPDSISQDGGSQSSLEVFARDPSGKPIVGLPLRLDMSIGGVVQDYGTLSARTIVTNSDGKARAIYTSPAAPPAGTSGTATRVTIVVTPSGSNFQASTSQTVDIRLVPPGVILPPTGTPSASFTFAPANPVVNSPVQFDASASGCGASGPACQITSYVWSFGDGGQATGRNASHTYSSQQTYTVTLTVTTDRGLAASGSQVVTVGAAGLPTPSFTVSPSTPGVGEQVFFNALASTPGAGHSSIVSYRWTFGDGATGSGATTSHTYTASGTYTVQLAVTDDAGSTVTSVGTQVTVGNPVAPTASFTFSPTSPSVGETVIFDYRLSAPAGGQPIVSLDWNFGDGSAPVHCPGNAACASDGITTHAFGRAGTFNVALVVTDAAGRTGTKSTPVSVSAGGGNAPTSTFTFSPAAPGVNETVFFNGSTSTAGSGHTIASYTWTFGDGVTVTGNNPTPTHAYTAAGTYSVQLRVTDETGQSTTSSATTITVGNPPAPTANFTSSPSTPSVGEAVVFDASTSTTAQGQTITDYAWNFGDDTPVVHGTGRIQSHTYTRSGTFTVNLVVTDSAGRNGAKANTVTVGNGSPSAVLTVTKTGGNSVQGDGSASAATSGSSITNYTFTWGDGTTTSTASSTAAKTYAAPGTYSVTLRTTDNLGRSGSSAAQSVTVP